MTGRWRCWAPQPRRPLGKRSAGGCGLLAVAGRSGRSYPRRSEGHLVHSSQGGNVSFMVSARRHGGFGARRRDRHRNGRWDLDCQDPELHIFEKIATIQLRSLQLALVVTIPLLSRAIVGSGLDRKPDGVAVGLAFLGILFGSCDMDVVGWGCGMGTGGLP